MRLLLVIDVPFYRDGLQKLLSLNDDFTVVGAVSSRDALSAATQSLAELVLLDTSDVDAQAILRQLRTLPHAPNTVALGVDELNPGIVEWMEAGVCGYVSRQANYAEMVQILHSAHRNEWVCSPRVMSFLLGRLSTLAGRTTQAMPSCAAPGLTPREREVLELVGKGLSNKRIANSLRISHRRRRITSTTFWASSSSIAGPKWSPIWAADSTPGRSIGSVVRSPRVNLSAHGDEESAGSMFAW